MGHLLYTGYNVFLNMFFIIIKEEQINLFDSLVASVLNYGSEVWGYDNNRLLYEYGEILTRVSIAVTRACECHANANECQYFSIFVQ